MQQISYHCSVLLICDHRGLVGLIVITGEKKLITFHTLRESVNLETDPVSETPSLTKISKKNKLQYGA